jgi:hypothetical protein
MAVRVLPLRSRGKLIPGKPEGRPWFLGQLEDVKSPKSLALRGVTTYPGHPPSLVLYLPTYVGLTLDGAVHYRGFELIVVDGAEETGVIQEWYVDFARRPGVREVDVLGPRPDQRAPEVVKPGA